MKILHRRLQIKLLSSLQLSKTVTTINPKLNSQNNSRVNKLKVMKKEKDRLKKRKKKIKRQDKVLRM
jgi:hypothetical protein